jgi:outer membrane receptor protein involved in Fe transport
VYVQGDNLVLPNFYNFSNATQILTREIETRYRTAAFYGSANLSYANMLYLTLTGRNEMSSTLPEGENAFFYPSASLAFVFTEAFGMSNNNILPFGKLRLNYAQVGSDAPEYALNTVFAQTTAGDGWTTGVAFPLPDRNGNSVAGYSLGNILGNPNLKPENTSSLEAGLDLRFLNNRIGLDVTYYNSESKDLIVLSPIAGSSGYTTQYLNAGSIKNNGIELALNITPIKTKDWRWDVGLNWSKNKSEVVEIAEGVDILFLGGFEGSAVYAVVGEQYGTIYGTRWLRDDAGNLVIDDEGYPIQDAQVGAVGDINPDWIAGISNSLSWKGLSLSFLLDWREGGEIWNGTRGALTFFGRTTATEGRYTDSIVFDGLNGYLDENGNVVTEGENTIKVPLDQNWYRGLGGGFGGPTEQFIEDGSYIKLRELTLTYSLNPKWLESTPIAGLDVSFIGRNLWLSTDYTGVDPETSLTGSNNSQGMDYFNMPNTKSYGVNLRLTL